MSRPNQMIHFDQSCSSELFESPKCFRSTNTSTHIDVNKAESILILPDVLSCGHQSMHRSQSIYSRFRAKRTASAV